MHIDPRALLLLSLVASACAAPATTAPPATTQAVYAYGERSRDGIGKFYMGREIAHYMSHRGADWLDRPEREEEEKPQALVDAIELKPTDVVADIGVGTGYFAFRLAPKVPRGRVLGVDIQPEMLELLRKAAKEHGVTNVEPVLGETADPKLPAGAVDVVLMVDAYHEFDQPREMMEAVVRALKPGGRVVLVEYRAEDPDVPIKPLHKMTEAQAKLEMAAAGLRHVETKNVLPRQHLMIFEKPRR
jgi:ubiquinone/menaquinone biosynthesis C-methylase UbiE